MEVSLLSVVYLNVILGCFGTNYHWADLKHYQPYIVLFTAVLNGFVMLNVNASPKNGHAVMRRQLWRTCCVAVFGVLLNYVHAEMFVDFHIDDPEVNSVLSFLYLFLFALARYLGNRNVTVYVHVLFLFVPFRRVWQVSLYGYCALITSAIYLLFKRYPADVLCRTPVLFYPLIDWFAYLRVDNYLVLAGVLQLYVDFFLAMLPLTEAREKLVRAVRREREHVEALLESDPAGATESEEQVAQV